MHVTFPIEIAPECPFPLSNIPFGIFNTKDSVSGILPSLAYLIGADKYCISSRPDVSGPPLAITFSISHYLRPEASSRPAFYQTMQPPSLNQPPLSLKIIPAVPALKMTGQGTRLSSTNLRSMPLQPCRRRRAAPCARPSLRCSAMEIPCCFKKRS